MSMRRLARQRVLQLLYALEYSGESFEETEARFLRLRSGQRKGWSDFARTLARKTYERREALDREIAGALEHWRIERLALTDRLCLRLGLCEMQAFPEIPLRVTLDEYVELARRYGGQDSPAYVNGVLDRLARNYRQKDFQALARGSDGSAGGGPGPTASVAAPEAEPEPETPR